MQYLRTDYSVVCEVLEPVISAKAKVFNPPPNMYMHSPLHQCIYLYLLLWWKEKITKMRRYPIKQLL